MRQQALFAIREVPQGFIFQPDFLTVEEEQDLLAFMESLPFYEFKLHGVAAKRRVIHFGLRYTLATRVLGTAPEIPAQLVPLRDRAAALAGVSPADFSQLLINKYPLEQASVGITTRLPLASSREFRWEQPAPCDSRKGKGINAERRPSSCLLAPFIC